MVRENRTKVYRFPVGSLLSTAAGIVDIYTPYALNGEFLGINNQGGNYTATGSLFLFASGAGAEGQIYKQVSGTTTGNIAAAAVKYPRATVVDTNGSAFPGDNPTLIPMNSILHVIGSGFGASKSGLGLNLIYV